MTRVFRAATPLLASWLRAGHIMPPGQLSYQLHAAGRVWKAPRNPALPSECCLASEESGQLLKAPSVFLPRGP